MKSFALNKKMKEQLAYDLTASAISKKIKMLDKKLTSLNSEFWVEHDARVAKILQIDKSRYSDLIQSGALVATSAILASKVHPHGVCWDQELRNMASAMRSRLECSGINAFIASDGYTYRNLTVRFSSAFTVPTANLASLDIAISSECSFHKRSCALISEYIDIIKAADKFHYEVKSLLDPIRTYRALIDSFPEAGKYVTAPVAAKNELLPKQAFDSVRKQLSQGVPPTSNKE